MTAAVLLAAAGLVMGGFAAGAVFEGCRRGGSLDLKLCLADGHQPKVLPDSSVACARCTLRLMMAVPA